MKREVTVRVLILFSVHLVICFVLAVGAFYKQSQFVFFLLLLFCGAECYLLLRKAVERHQILMGVEKIRDGSLAEKIEVQDLHGDDRLLAEAVNNIGDGLLQAVDDSTKNERNVVNGTKVMVK